jgi:CRP/FNR family transcriptional regulator, cyclic AMP receptor protein
MNRSTFSAGSTIISEGEDGNSAFIITNGSVEVIVGQGKKAKTVAHLKAGDVFGEMSLIEPGPRSATVRAVTDTECEVASYDDFMASIQESPEQSVKFMKTLVLRLRQMNEVLAHMDPERRGLREIFRAWRKDFDQANAAEADRWNKLSDEERESERFSALMYMGPMF